MTSFIEQPGDQFADDIIHCQCNHMSSFAGGSDPKPAELVATNDIDVEMAVTDLSKYELVLVL